MENALWGASRIHGELLKLGYEVAQSTVSKYMARGGRPPSQSWKTFLRNHAEAIAAIDMCMVIFSEVHLRRILTAYAAYYNQTRTHLALHKDCPLERPIQRFGSVVAIPVLAGLHHQYARM